MTRSLLFYSFFPLGYHNVESERKALAFQHAGYDVLHAVAPLIRNPRLGDGRRVLQLARQQLNQQDATAGSGDLREKTLTILPPRQLSLVRQLNGFLVMRQLHRALRHPEGVVAWIRWPTPEIVAALPGLRPAALIYECVDAYWETPGIVGTWRNVYEQAEQRLVEMADLVVATSEKIASRFRPFASERVRLLPHGVDLFPPSQPPARHDGDAVLGFVGTLDYRLDLAVLRALAFAHPEWRIRLIGPLGEGFEPERLEDLPNISIEPPVPYPELGSTLGGFDVGLMPYFDHPVFAHMSPVKNLELMAAGKPAVSRPSVALEPFRDLVYFATTPEEFVSQTELALAEDGAGRVERRRKIAAEHTWERRHKEMLSLVDEALAGHATRKWCT